MLLGSTQSSWQTLIKHFSQPTLSQWRRRNALKMWSGWPTFPMIFVDGILVGGYRDLQALIDSAELKNVLDTYRRPAS